MNDMPPLKRPDGDGDEREFLTRPGVNQEIVPPGHAAGPRLMPRKKSVTAAAVGTYSAMECLPPKCRMDASMNDSEEYRRRAGECLLFTQYVTSERSKQLLVQMALGWRDLAERAEQQRRSGDISPTGTDKT